jgi:hypothetical protein
MSCQVPNDGATAHSQIAGHRQENFVGLIDEVRIIGAALNQKDIAALCYCEPDLIQTGGDINVNYEFYFGSTLPATASADAILDDGTGFAAGREQGLEYGWSCDGDNNVDYADGRRGTGRDDGLGINHFDRAGTCGTTDAPKPVNWEISVPNGVYTAKVDFGENHYSQGCETEGLLCHTEMGRTGDAGTGCVFEGAIRVEDGRFTVTGYSHDTGLCHSISAVWIETSLQSGDPSVDYQFFFGTGLPAAAKDGAIVDDGTGFANGRDQGLNYGWSCDGDSNVDYSGGRRGTGRDDGLGINHFDRVGTCGTTDAPKAVNWELEVSNGVYAVLVDQSDPCSRCALRTAGKAASLVALSVGLFQPPGGVCKLRDNTQTVALHFVLTTDSTTLTLQ